MKTTKIKFMLFFAVLTLGLSTSASAQGSTNPADGDEIDGPPAPINQAIPALALLGIGFAYRAFAKAE